MKTMSCISKKLGLLTLILSVLFLLLGATFFSAEAQTITTNKVDYMPGDTVFMSGEGWRTDEPVDIVFTELELLDSSWVDITKTITCDGSGSFTDQLYVVVNADLGAFFQVTATGQLSLHVATVTFNDAVGRYAIDFSAYDPDVYTKGTPATIPVPSGGRLSASPLGLTKHNQTVESLMPQDLGLGQIVAFEFYIRVDNCSSCPNGEIQFTARFNTITTSAKDFGFDPTYLIYAAFVDGSAAGGIDDPAGNATVSGVTESYNSAGHYIEGKINVQGLDAGDEIPVEVWVVLKPTVPAGANGNVHSILYSAKTAGSGSGQCAPNQKICTGNQTIPLMNVGNFCSDVDVSINKFDNVDPVTICNQLVYTINVTNAGPSVANNVVVTDNLDSKTTYVSHVITDNTGTTTWTSSQAGQTWTFSTGFLNVGETVTITMTVTVNSNAPHTGIGGAGVIGNCPTGKDLCNHVCVTSIGNDINPSNNSYSQPTGVTCETVPPVFTFCPPGSTLGCNPTSFPAPGVATATDNCGTPVISSSLGTSVAGTGCTWTKTRTYTATDACGNTATCTQVFTYTVDNTVPVITATGTPEDGELGCNPDAAAIEAALGTATATDNCGPVTPTVTTDPVIVTNCPTGCNYSQTRTWHVTDACGNQAVPVSRTATWTIDQTKPVITTSGTPGNGILGCNPGAAAIEAALGTATVTDNCGTVTPTVSTGEVVVNGCIRTQTRTWTAQDACGNNADTKTRTATWTFDQTAPVITLAAAGTLNCNPTTAQIAAAFGAATVTDNCSSGLTATGTVGTETGSGCTRSTTKTWTVTDACGNTGTNSQTVTYTRDTQAPVITLAAASTPGCNPTEAEIAAAFGAATVTDNCSAGLTASGNIGTETGSGCTRSTTKTWTVTDACGNTGTNSQTVTYTRDTQLPVITLTAAGALNCNPTLAQITASFGTASVSDNCSTGLTATGTIGDETGTGCTRSTTKTWTVTDACGNTGTNSQTVTYTHDTQAPVITLAAAGTPGCNPTEAEIAAAFGTATVSDNCSMGLTATGTIGQESGTGCARSITKTWTVTDACGNTGTNSQTLTYTRDTQAPTITLAAASTPVCNPTDEQIAAAFGAASVSDNCSTGLTATGTIGGETGSGCTYSKTKSWTVTDACGNTGTNSQTVTYTRDTQLPVITLAAAATLGCNPDATQIAAAFGTASVADNCSTGLTANGTVGNETGSGCTYSTTKSWTVTDNCGNVGVHSQTVTYTRDTEAPVIYLIGPTSTVPLGCNPTAADIETSLGSAGATDNCGPVTALPTTGDVVVNGCLRSQTRTWTSVDACGNHATPVSRTVTWTVDLTPPVITATGTTLTLGCNPNAATIEAALGTATATDNCGPVTPTATTAVVVITGCINSQTRTWNVSDGCNNAATPISRTVTWTVDLTKPIITATGTPINGELGCNPTTDQIQAALGTATATDNCGPVTPTATTGSIVVTNCPTGCNYSQTRTWNVTDACGNVAIPVSRTATWTEDQVSPVITLAAAGILGCNPTAEQIASAFGSATVTDNCSTGLTATGTVGTETGTGCTRSTTKSWTVTDACGNIGTKSQTVTYTRDTQAPVITATGTTLTLGCNPNAATIEAALGTATATDNCGPVTPTATTAVVVITGCINSQTRTWNVSDGCNNAATPVSRTVTWTVDLTKPIITATGTPIDGELGCNPTTAQIQAALGTATATDNCGPVTPTATTGSIVVTNCPTGCNYSQTRTWNVTDACGNVATPVSRTATWTEDQVAPVITLSAAGTLGCNPTAEQIASAFGSATVTDNCSTGLTATGTVGNETGSGCTRSTTKSWTVTDACGNTGTKSQTVTYTRDTQAPVITLATAGTLGCNPTAAQIATAFGTATVSDNCSTGLTATGTIGNETGSGCTYTTTKSWTVTDACGNTGTNSQTLTYTRDTELPVITLATAGTLGCNPTEAAIAAAFGAATVTDNCSTGLTATGTVGNETGSGCTRSITKTWTVTDACGNTGTNSQTVTYTRDTQAPVITLATAGTPGCNPTAAQIAAAFGAATVSDNCSMGLTATGTIGNETGSGCTYYTTKSWTVIDACGNTGTNSQTVTYTRDTELPVITLATAGTLGCNPTAALIAAAFGTATVSDNCSTGLTATGTVGQETGSGCTYYTTKSWTVTDACGNTGTNSQTLTYTRDIQLPVITLATAGTLGCNPTAELIAAAFGTATVSDNCSTGLIATGTVGQETGSGCTYSTTKSWTVTDACGNTGTNSQTVTYTRDTQLPVITLAPASTLGCNPTTVQVAAAFGAASVLDNCSTGLIANGTVGDETGSGCTYSTTKSWSVTDNCGNLGIHSQTVTYTRDTQPPVISLIGPTSTVPLGCNPNSDAIETALGSAVASDNCGPVTAVPTTGSVVEDGCLRSQTRTWTSVDACGNQATPVSRTVTWTVDVTKPIITATGTPSNGVLGCNPTPAQIETALGSATATDNCGPVTPTATTADVVISGCTRSQTRTWNVSDGCNNAATPVTRTVTWTVDLTAPVITATGTPPDGVLGCNPTSAQILAALGTATASDNCGPVTPTATTGSIVVTNCPTGCNYSQTRTWNVTDACGNSATPVSRTATWTADETKPVITATGTPSSGVLGCNPTAAQIEAALGTATATDNCGTVYAVPNTGTEAVNGCSHSQTRTWTCVDACGNQAITVSRTATWTIDVTNPVILLSSAGTLGCNPTAAQIAAAFGGATVTDNCSTGLIATGTIAQETGSGCFYSTTKNWTVTDACGNTGTNSQTVTYTRDTELPVITLATAGTLGCNPTAEQIAAAFGAATVSDNCSANLVATGTIGQETGSGCTRSTTKTWTVTDACGNTGTNSQTVTYTRDTQAPVITATGTPPDGVLGCNPTEAQIEAALGTATASDNCGTFTPTAVTGPVVPSQCPECCYTQTRTWTVTDACGNTATPVSRTITWTVDLIKPVITATGTPSDGELGCNPTQAQIEAALGTATATDNCGPVTLTAVTYPIVVSQQCPSGCNYSQTRTWTAVDGCNNNADPVSRTATWTVDTEAPVIHLTSAGTLGCNPTAEQIAAAFGTATVTDNCGTDLIATGTIGQETGSGCTHSITKTWTVSDACGNIGTNSQTVTFTRDTQAPVITIAAASPLGCNPTAVQIAAAFGNASVTDNCTTGLTATGTVGNETGSGCTYSTTKSWTVTDACGNTGTNSQTVTYTRDTENPVITLATATIPVCNPTAAQIAAAFGAATVTDNCSANLTATGTIGQETGSGCTYSTTKSWTVTDACGNTGTNSQTVTYTRDTELPVITLATAGTLGCNPTDAQIAAAFGAATVTDNCSANLTATGTIAQEAGSGCTYSTTKSWTVTDNCGNTGTNSQTVTYTRDTQLPVITLATAGTLGCNPTAEQIAAAFGAASVSDNCSANLTATGTVGQEAGSGCTYSTTKSWTVTDACGNTGTNSQTVTYTRDTELPVITLATAGTLGCNPTAALIAAAFGTATVSDNCSANLTATGTIAQETGSGCTYSTTKSWTVTDACGNTGTNSQTVTYTRDTELPVITLATAGTLSCNPTAAQIAAAFGAATVSDNCSANLTATGTVAQEAGSGCTYSTTKSWTVTDACGNTGTNSQTVTYTRDTQAPVITLATAGTLGCNPTAEQIASAFGSATVSDNCSANLIATGTVGQEAGSGCTYSTTKSWTVTDACGNTGTNSQTVTYTRDTQAPVITATGTTLTLGCNPNAAIIEAALGTATATDNCGQVTPTATTADMVIAGCTYSQTRTWNVSDACGNAATPVSRTVTWTVDLTKPVITATGTPIDGELACNPTPAEIQAALGTATATDNCGPVIPTASTGTVVVTNCPTGCNYSQTRTWTVTDACGNVATPVSRTATWTVDLVAPVITLAPASALSCNPTAAQIATAFGAATVTDNCSTGLTATGTIGNETGSGCTYYTTKSWTVTDNCGNTGTKSQTVTYSRDTQAPVITLATAGTLGCNPTAAQISAAFGTASVTDNCSTGLIATGSVGQETGSGCTYSTTKTWTVTDNCGNTGTNSQTVTYTRDTQLPVITLATAGTLGCNPTAELIAAAFGAATVTDNCSTGLTATGTVEQETGSGCTYSTTKTWTVTDACGNTGTNSQTVSYTRDTQLPLITMAPASPLGCNPTTAQIEAAFGTASVIDNCSTGLTATGSVGQEAGSGCAYSTTKTWTVTDNCGNTGTNSQTVTYTRDTELPVISLATAGTIGCNPTTAEIAAAFGTASVTDNCSTGLTASGSVGQETGSGCTYSTTKTWTVTDNCGNTGTNSQTVTYTRDTELPVITLASAGTLGCNPTAELIAASFGTASVSDNCSTGLTATGTVGQETGSGCTYSTTKTWTVTDACGNTGTNSQTVTYTRDTQLPLITVAPASTLGCNPTTAQIAAAFGAASVLDNCSTGLIANGTVGNETGSGCTYSTTKDWSVTDNCGNLGTHSQTVTYTRDTEAPVIALVGPTSTVPLGCNPTPAEIETALGAAIATDNCGPVTPVPSTGQVVVDGCLRSQTRTWTCADACGNQATPVSRTATWTVDLTPPVITATGTTLTLGCNPDAAAIEAALGTATATDNCGPVTPTASTNNVVITGCTHSQTRTWNVSDACNNAAIPVSRIVTWTVDLTAPVITATGTTLELGCNPTEAQIEAALGTATATDNCGPLTPTAVTDPVLASQCPECCYTQTRTWNVTDACGNAAVPVSRTVTWTVDLVKPVITASGTPPDGILGCNPTAAQIEAALGTAYATDNCGPATLTGVTYPVVVSQQCPGGCNYSQTRTWNAVDACGNNADPVSRTATWTVDLVPPVITLTSASTLGCNPTAAEIAAAFGTATVTDNCSTNLTATGTIEQETGSGCTYSTTKTWTSTDVCGNTGTNSQTVTYTRDTQPPVITLATASPLGCNPTAAQIAAAFGSASVTDNCSTGLTTIGTVGQETGSGCTWSTTKTWTSTDACGNTGTNSQTVTYTRDTQVPVITLATAGTLGCNPTAQQIAAAFGAATVSDNCSTGLTATGIVGQETGSGCTYSTTKTWTVTDNCSNTGTNSQTVTYTRDTEIPVITATGTSLTLGCNPDASTLNAALGTATATDNCGQVTPTATTGNVIVSGCSASQTRTWNATDACGNAAAPVSRTVTWIFDLTLPVITATGTTLELGCNPTQAQIEAALGTATATDNCGPVSPTAVTGPVMMEQCPECCYSQTRTWTVTDACGNAAIPVSRTVTWTVDLIKPVLTAIGNPADGVLGCNPDIFDIEAALGFATATDNCGPVTITEITYPVVVSQQCPSGCNYSQTRTWNGVDACGNIADPVSRTATWTVDLTPPVLTCPGTVTVSCASAVPQPDISLVTATDNCTTGVTIAWISDQISNQTCANRYTISRTYKGTDGCGNEGTCTQTIIVNDQTPPALTCPGPVTVSCASEVGQPNTSLVTATDNCGGTVTVTWVGDQITNQTCANRYTITRTYKGVDVCGNEGFCTQTITVNDMTAPVITCPPNITINCQASQLPENTGTATALDNCDLQPAVTYSDVVIGGNCTGNYTINRTWTATDLCQNAGTCLQVITVVDTDAPTWITLPGALNASLDCDDENGLSAALLLEPTATDNCSQPIITGPTMETDEGSCAGNYVITRTWSATDGCGNTQQVLYTQTITVTDTDPPTWITVAGDLDRALSCGDEDGLAEALALEPVAQDNCTTIEIDLITDETTPGNCAGNYTRVRTWSVIDDCRNEGALFTQTITVSDVVPPVIGNVPENLLVSCTAQVPASAPIPVTTTDNCNGPVTVTVADVISDYQCINRYTLTRTWTATDECGNSSTASQVITVYEVSGPIITKVPADETYSCSLMVPATNSLTVTVTDDCGGEPTVTVNEVITEYVCANHYTMTRTWIAVDACGNTSNAMQTVIVNDMIAPEISCPGPLTIPCGGAVPDPDISLVTAFDNCGLPMVTWVSDVTSGQSPEFTITRTYMATDICGNSATCTQLITVTTAAVAAEIIQPEQYPFCGMINNMLSSSVTLGTPTTYSWNVSSSGGDWSILSGSGTGTVYYNAGTTSAVFMLTVTDNNGCTSTTELPMDCVPAGEYCSMTQGFYGNPGGTYCNGMTTLALLNNELLTSPLVVGWLNNTMTFGTGEGQCVIDHMPGSGPAKRITGANTCASHPGIQTRASSGKIYNILLSQTITYGLNLRLSPLMVTLPMGTSWLTTAESTGCGEGLPESNSVGNTWEYHTISSAVWTKLTEDYGATPDAWDLYDLANRALGNDATVATGLLTPISDAVAMMNESFDECMWGTFDGGYIGPTSPFGGTPVDPANTEDIHLISLNIVPNPFEVTTEIRFMTTWDTKVKVEIYNVLGIVVETPFYGTVNKDTWNSLFFTADPSMPASTYICVIRTDQGTEMRRMILIR